MTACTRTLWGDPDGLVCVETGEHDTHSFVASAAPDGHDANEAEAEGRFA